MHSERRKIALLLFVVSVMMSLLVFSLMKFVSLEKEPTTNGRRKKRSEKKKNVCTREIKRKNTDATAKVSQFRERNLVECYLYSKRVRKRTTSSLVIRFEAILMCFSLCYFFLSR